MSSVRQQLVDAVATRLALIDVGTTFGDHTCTSTLKSITPWRKHPYNVAQVPAIAYWDTDATVEVPASGQHEHRLTIHLEGYLAGTAVASAARELMADIIAALGSDPRWSTLARWTDIDSHKLLVEQTGDVVAAVAVQFTIVYRTPLWRM